MFGRHPSEPTRGVVDAELFAGCHRRELRFIDGLATIVDLSAGQLLCRPGDIGRECFLLLDAAASVLTTRGLAPVPPGLMVGEIALLTSYGRRTAEVVPRSDTRALVFTPAELRQLMAELPLVGDRILREATRRLVENTYRARLPVAQVPV
jgi:CRP-like cAMP-binding protein